MKLTKTLALVAALTLAASAAHAAVFVMGEQDNTFGNNVSAQAEITAVGNHVTLRVTNTTQDFAQSNQALSDVYLNFTSNVGGPTNFTQAGQLGNIDSNGNVSLIAGAPTRWEANGLFGDTYLDLNGAGLAANMIASNDLGNTSGLVPVYNPYIMGTAIFEFDLAGASSLQLSDLLFSFGSHHEFVGHGLCVTGCGVGIGTQLAAVPEMSTWALMILGFGGVGAMLRHQRRRQRLALA